MKDRLIQYAHLMRLHRPIGIYLLLWPTLWALWIAAEGHPDLLVVFVFVSGVVLMRSAGCVINDYADREFDPHVERSRDRPIAAGRVKPTEALALFVVLCLGAFALVLLMNKLTIYLSLAGVVLAASYPFMKRYTHLPQVYLGAAFGWAVPMAFAAQTGEAPQLAWLLFGTALVWAVIYDTFYAMVDREDDRKVGVKSTAILFGDADLFVIGGLQLLMLAALLLIGDMAELSRWYYGSVVIAATLMVYHQWLTRERQPAKCFQAFLHNHYIGMIIFIGIVLHYTFEPAAAM